MKIPSNFTVPDFVIEMVRVASEDWPKSTDPITATARIRDLRAALLNPDVLYVMCQMVVDLANAQNSTFDHNFNGLHDVVNQQQLIGEIRGLRRFFAELEKVHEQLVEVVTESKSNE